MSKDLNIRLNAQDHEFIKRNAASMKMSNSEYAGIIFRAGMINMMKALSEQAAQISSPDDEKQQRTMDEIQLGEVDEN